MRIAHKMILFVTADYSNLNDSIMIHMLLIGSTGDNDGDFPQLGEPLLN